MAQPPDDERARATEEAAMWLEKLERAITIAESFELRKWLKASLHREVIVERCKLWHGPEILAVLGELVPIETFSERVERQYDRVLLAITLGVSSIALATVMIAASRVWSKDEWQDSLRAAANFHTAVDERRTIALPDGSSIVLNAGTQLLLRYRPSSRDVVLLRGEATFKAEPDAARPFLVSAGARQLEVQAGEATFNVHRVAADRIELTVIEGQVLAPASRSSEPLPPALLRARVSTGEHLFIAGEGGLLGPGWQWPTTLKQEEIDERIAWQTVLAEPTT
jgi:transmembrane sensor